MSKKLYIILICVVVLNFTLFSNSYADFSKQAVEYYKKAKMAMEKNDLNTAIKFLQKTVLLDSYYVEAHNDLGVLYEKKAMLSKARKQYKTAINIQPDYSPAYMNLAMLEESVGNIEDAVFYWKARIAFGKASDKWAERAKVKLRKYAPEEMKIDAAALMEEVLERLQLNEEQRQKLAKKHMNYGRTHFKNAAYSKALSEFQIAYKLSPDDVNIQRFLSKTKVNIIQGHFSDGIAYFNQKDYENAEYEFNKIIDMLPGKNIKVSGNIEYIRDHDVKNIIINAVVNVMKIYFSEGLEHYRNNNYDSSKRDFNNLVNIVPDERSKYLYSFYKIREVSESFPDDVKAGSIIAEATVEIMRVYFSKGTAYYIEKDYKKARNKFTKLIQMLPEKQE